MKTHSVSATVKGQTLSLRRERGNRLQISLYHPQNTSLRRYQAYFRYLKAAKFIPAQYSFDDILWSASRDYTELVACLVSSFCAFGKYMPIAIYCIGLTNVTELKCAITRSLVASLDPNPASPQTFLWQPVDRFEDRLPDRDC